MIVGCFLSLFSIQKEPPEHNLFFTPTSCPGLGTIEKLTVDLFFLVTVLRAKGYIERNTVRFIAGLNYVFNMLSICTVHVCLQFLSKVECLSKIQYDWQ